MKSAIARTVTAALTIAMITVSLLPSTAFAAAAVQSSQSASGNGLAGTWHVQVTLHNCVTGVPGQPFQSLLSFNQGGTMIGTTSNPAFQPGQRSSDFGIWSAAGPQTYSAVSEAFILFSSSANPPVPAFQRGTQRITQVISVDGDQFTAVASVQFFDTNGNLLISACANATGQRFQ